MHDNPNEKGAGSADAHPRPEVFNVNSNCIWAHPRSARRKIHELASELLPGTSCMSAYPYLAGDRLRALRAILVHEGMPARCSDYWWHDAHTPFCPLYQCDIFNRSTDVVIVGSSDAPGDCEQQHERQAFKQLARARWQRERHLAGEGTAEALTSSTVIGTAFPEEHQLDRIDWSTLQHCRRTFLLPWPTPKSQRLFEHVAQRLIAGKHVRKVRWLSWPLLHSRFTAWESLARAVQLATEEGGEE